MGNSPPRRSSASARPHELDRYTNPTGLYPSCPWDVRAARRLIIEKHIAPRFPGRETKESCFTQECPICFMFYPGALNVATCCKKTICTECYLQLKPPKKVVSCPYCNREAFGVKYTAPAVLNISSVYTDSSAYTSPETSQSSPMAASDVTQHFASADDRNRLRDDLRSQLNLTSRPLTTPPPRPSMVQAPLARTASASFIIASTEDAARGVGQPRYIIASAAEAARLEEMMLLEAIRRSMRDLNVAKDEDGSASGSSSSSSGDRHGSDDIDGSGRGSDEFYEGEYDTLHPSQVAVQVPMQRRPSTNPFDEVHDDASTAASRASSSSSPRRGESARWNPFDA